MQERLEELRAEYRRGLREIALLEQRRQDVHHTLLRISGAIQVLEEFAGHERSQSRGAAAADEARPMRAVATR